MRRALASLALLSTSLTALAPAVAQPGLEPTAAPVQPTTEPASTTDVTESKDPTRAMALSAGAAALGLAGIYLGANMREGGDTPIMMVGGLVALVGPSAGAWYVDGNFKFTAGFGIRLAGVALMGFAYGAVIDRACMRDACGGPIRDPQSDTMIGIGAAAVVAGIVYDVATAGSRAREHNARLGVTPLVSATGTGEPVVGLAGRF